MNNIGCWPLVMEPHTQGKKRDLQKHWGAKKSFWFVTIQSRASQEALVVKNPSASAGDMRDEGSILGPGRYPGGGHGNPCQYACLGNSMDREAWQATVHRVAQSQTRQKRLSMQHAQFRVKHFPLAGEKRDKNTRKNFWLFWCFHLLKFPTHGS